MHISLKHDIPVKVLVNKSSYQLCAIIKKKKKDFYFNLCKQQYAHENNNTHQEFLNSEGIR